MPGPTLADVDRALHSFDWMAWRATLARRYDAWFQGTVHGAAAAASEAAGHAWRSDDPWLEAFGRRYVADRVTQLSDTTKERLRAAIAGEFGRAADAGTAPDVRGVLAREFAEFSASRALTIARTETAMALNFGAAASYRQQGYNYVQISDGDGDEPCALADGQIWSIEYFMANALEHPNCERSAQPISDEDAEAAGIDQE